MKNYDSKSDKVERGYRKKKKSLKSKFKKIKKKKRRYEESESEDELSRESSEDSALSIYAEEDSDDVERRLIKLKKKNRRARSIENNMNMANYGMIPPSPYPQMNPYYGYQTPNYMPTPPAMNPMMSYGMSPMMPHQGYFNNPYVNPMMTMPNVRPNFSNYK